jgi:hypothetical protein
MSQKDAGAKAPQAAPAARSENAADGIAAAPGVDA